MFAFVICFTVIVEEILFPFGQIGYDETQISSLWPDF